MADYLRIVEEFDREKLEAEADEAIRQLREQGWVAIKSRALRGEIIVWVVDARVAVPVRFEGAVRYALHELQHLTEAGIRPANLRLVHEAKQLCNGEIAGIREG